MSTELQIEGLTLTEQAKELRVTNATEYEEGGQMLTAAKELEKKIKATFGPMKTKAHAAHKEVCDQENELLDPIKKVKKIAGEKLGAYQASLRAEEKKRRDEETGREQEAADAEKQRLQEAADAEAGFLKATGEPEAATRVQTELEAASEAVQAEVETRQEEIMSAPVEAPSVAGTSLRKNWKFEIQDVSQIPVEYLIPDEKKIGAAVRGAKGDIEIPGVRIFSEDKVV